MERKTIEGEEAEVSRVALEAVPGNVAPMKLRVLPWSRMMFKAKKSSSMYVFKAGVLCLPSQGTQYLQ